MIKEEKISSKIQIDPSITKKYKGKVLFMDKYEWAVNHVKGRDIENEIKVALEKERISNA